MTLAALRPRHRFSRAISELLNAAVVLLMVLGALPTVAGRAPAHRAGPYDWLCQQDPAHTAGVGPMSMFGGYLPCASTDVGMAWRAM